MPLLIILEFMLQLPERQCPFDVGFTLLGFRDVEIPSPTPVSSSRRKWKLEYGDELMQYIFFSRLICSEGCEVLLCLWVTPISRELLDHSISALILF